MRSISVYYFKIKLSKVNRIEENWVKNRIFKVRLYFAWLTCFSNDSGIGASPYVMNCNVTIDSQDLALGKEIASAIRGSNVNGLKGVQTMAFPHEGKIEIACNVESFEDQEVTETSKGSQYMAYSVLGDHFYYVSPHYIEAQVKKLASDRGIGTIGRALIGFTPQECKSCAEYTIRESIGEFWKIREGVFMWANLRFRWNCKKKISGIANFSYWHVKTRRSKSLVPGMNWKTRSLLCPTTATSIYRL